MRVLSRRPLTKEGGIEHLADDCFGKGQVIANKRATKNIEQKRAIKAANLIASRGSYITSAILNSLIPLVEGVLDDRRREQAIDDNVG